MSKTLIILISIALASAAVVPFDNAAVEKVFKEKVPTLFLFLSENTESIAAFEALKAFDETNPEILLTTSSSEDGHGFFDRLAEYLGVDVSETPKIIYMGAAQEKYQYDQTEITKDTLADFVKRIASG